MFSLLTLNITELIATLVLAYAAIYFVMLKIEMDFWCITMLHVPVYINGEEPGYEARWGCITSIGPHFRTCSAHETD